MTHAAATVEITPAMMAEAFWNMSDTLQAEFFAELAKVIQADHASGNTSAYSLGEAQWYHLGEYMRLSLAGPGTTLTPAGHMPQAMAAPLYLHTLRAAGQF